MEVTATTLNPLTALKFNDRPALDLTFATYLSEKYVKSSTADVVLSSIVLNSNMQMKSITNLAKMLETPPGVSCYYIMKFY